MADKSPSQLFAEEIRSRLEAAGRGSRQGHRPSAQSDFGVYTADLRKIVKEFRKSLKPRSGQFVYDVGLALLNFNNTECRQVGYELVSGHAGARGYLNVSCVEALGAGLDNWCCVDNFCSAVAGVAWIEGQISDATIKRWARSSDQWWRRAALVSTVSLNVKSRGGTGDTARTLAVCRLLADDQEVMVQKALSWALRELIPWDRKAVQEFMEAHGSLSARVKREVSRKLETGKKN